MKEQTVWFLWTGTEYSTGKEQKNSQLLEKYGMECNSQKQDV